ncbi:MAG TPA: threonine synthase, partial [Nocardioides sp.]|nr:threonine synthase [Nocardioides sp.]
DDEIRDGIVLLARTEGIFTETAGGTTVAVTKKLAEAGVLDPSLETVVINTGHGLKTLDAVSGKVGPRATIAANYAAFEAAGIS